MGLREEMYEDEWAIGPMLDRDDEGRALKEMQDVLVENRAALRRELDRGVSPDEFKKGQAIIAGYDAALRGLEKAWERRRQPV